MDYTTFKYLFSGQPIILSKEITGDGKKAKLGKTPQKLLNQITRWQKRGLLVKLKKGMYLLNEHDRKLNPSRLFLANQMYVPSYVSLEYALYHYGLIPERVVEVTSVTTKKTLYISNPEGKFTYHHVTVPAFRGFRIIRDENGLGVFIAEPEKAVLDFLYFNLALRTKGVEIATDIFTESYRFQDVDMLNEQRLLELAVKYNNAKLNVIAKLFCRFRKEQTHI
jgi:hypothetical protein